MDKGTAKSVLESILNEHPELAGEFGSQTKKPMINQTVRIPIELKDEAKALAKKQNTDLAKILRKALEIGLAKLKDA
ncbi:hypothetical protein QUF74_02365 [Candidatus Halobeggiatoa sp. HSG11]|nr:hypothetical protein [Candidatus Halobeggiatoa sp. HSG11]